MTRRRAWWFVAFLLFAACSTRSGSDEAHLHTQSPPSTPASHAAEAASSEVTRPKPGIYVYDLVGRGDTSVPQGAQITESLTVQGDVYTVDVSNNQNANQRSLEVRWSSDRVVQLDNETVIRGTRGTCPYNPPLVILHIPIRAEKFKPQETGVASCRESFDIEVFERETVQDATGQPWSAWVVQIQAAGADRTRAEKHWFSPKLGRDIRIETASDSATAHQETAQILRSYPQPE